MTTTITYKERISKKYFIEKIVEMFGIKTLTRRTVLEETADGMVHVTLYYVNKIHRASWYKGRGCIFDNDQQPA